MGPIKGGIRSLGYSYMILVRKSLSKSGKLKATLRKVFSISYFGFLDPGSLSISLERKWKTIGNCSYTFMCRYIYIFNCIVMR